MKKKFVYIVCSLIIAASLSACGDAMVDNEVNATTAPAVTNAPVTTPRAENGIVDDNDGLIEDNNNNNGGILDNGSMNDMDRTDGAEVNTQPSSNPSATVKPSSTVKPSATVNP